MATEHSTDVLIIGGGTGGVAAALGAASLGCSVILTEETDWIGGQITSQAVPPDEHPWIESFGCTKRYRALREGIRDYYRQHHPLTEAERKNPALDPGGGAVSRICHEPRVGVAVMEQMLAPHRTSGRVRVMTHHKPVAADVQGDRVRAVTLKNLRSGDQVTISAPFVLDATELGDLLPLTRTEYVTGAESKKQTDEPHATDSPEPENVQGFTWCFAAAFDPAPDADHVIEKPRQWERWRDYVPHLTPAWPGKLLSWTYSQPISLKAITRPLFPEKPKGGNFWIYRKIVRDDIYEGQKPHEVSLVNWPMNDYWEHNVIDKPAEDVAVYLEEARQLSLSLMYWMQTEAPRHDDKGTGYRGLYLRPDLMGADDGLAMAPYFRESRRIKALFTVTENHVGSTARYGKELDVRKLEPGQHAEVFSDSVGIGYYRIDLHPSAAGKNYIDIASLPFQIPLGALIPQRVENLLPACKNLGVTHITNGCYRLHPVEWNIGEAAGLLAGFCLKQKLSAKQVREDKGKLGEFQGLLREQGVELEWPDKVYPKA